MWKGRGRRAAVVIVYIVVSGLVVGAGLEVAIRMGVVPMSDWRPRIKTCGGAGIESRFHKTYGWTLHPNASYLRQLNDRDPNFYRVNEEGFRDTFDAGNKTAIVIGDSFTFGELASQNETYPFLLDMWMPSIRVRNYGMRAYGTAQAYTVYRDVADNVPHKLVILGYYLGNDAFNNVDTRDSRRPQFKVINGTLVQVSEPRRERSVLGVLVRTIYPSPSRLLEALAFLFLSGPSPPGPWQKIPPQGTSLDRQLSLTRHLVGAIAETATASNASLVIVGIPERSEVNQSNPFLYPYEVGRPYWNAQRRMLRRVASDHENTTYLDVRPPLSAKVQEGVSVYGRVDGHLNAAGYRRVAQTIFHHINRTGIVQPSTTPNFSRDYTRSSVSCPS